ncbi:toxin-antitoxin system HicB family antitoxin [Scytonema sp. UIC 10036]|uniref:toxin-antitoxin system HicB family antitoxin n=1 Tax=Scytonema sp. UIC 10036 TaxID=2304196 RepID=UPI0012DA6716|nr:toxin-antitoxin system HicB family antitoxin [Scytonema sp. UIC 10036]MUG95538.1 toxin-antitoxin system HicB family antitoxin [Scytonema sp. UIC 10036]
MASPQFCVRIPPELEERLVAYAKQSGISKTKVMVDALAYYLGCADDVPLIRRVLELEERMAAIEAEIKSK